MDRIGSKIATIISLFLLMAAWTQPAHAYIDPGTGSLVLQVVLGGLAGAALVVKLYWKHLLVRLGFRREVAETGREDAGE